MTTEIKYRLLCVTGPDTSYQIGQLFNSEMVAKNHALHIKDNEEQQYKIESVVTTTSILDTFTVPAHIPTVDEIAETIIGYADGSFSIDWGEDFDALSESDQRKVEDIVNEQISSCDCCGWYFHNQNMETGEMSGDWLCYSCAQTEADEAAEEEEEESE
jgi:hypothetical protein